MENEKMKVLAGDSFFKSLKKLGSFRHRYIEMPWYDFKHGIENLWNYKKIVWNQRPWDYYDILKMQQFQLKRLKTTLENGWEVDESRLPKIEKMSRCIEIIQNIFDDQDMENTYMERVGYESDKVTHDFVPVIPEEGEEDKRLVEFVTDSPYSDEETKKFYKDADELEKAESKELYEIINENSKGWWD